MKKLSVLGMLILVAMFSFTAKADIVTLDGANEIANAFFANSASSQKRALKSAAQLEYAWDSNSLTQTGSSVMKSVEEDPTFYVFNNPDGEGFVIVSGDSNTRSVIGYSYEGSVPMADEIPDPMKDYLLGIDEEIKWARTNLTSTGKNLKATLAETGGTQEQYWETPSWGQNAPFNNLCPIVKDILDPEKNIVGEASTKTGCVPTAFASIMRFHKWPLQGKNPYATGGLAGSWYYDQYNGINATDARMETINHSAVTYDWDNMPMTYSSSWTEAQKTQVATLMRNVGYAFDAEFGIYSTNWTEGDVPPKVLNSFDYTCDGFITGQFNEGTDKSINEWLLTIKGSLDKGFPIPYAANNSGTGDSRHMFVVDGYTSNNYFHFNFGWTGSGNGWFLITAVTPSQGDNYSWKSGAKHRAYINFRPNKKITISVAADPATAGSVTINGASVTSKEVEAGTQVTLQATGDNFAGWVVDETIVSTDNPYTFTVSATKTYTAKFAQTYQLQVQATLDMTYEDRNNSVTQSAENVYIGAKVDLTAIPTRGYAFDGWYFLSTESLDFVCKSTDLEYTATIEDNPLYATLGSIPVFAKFSQLTPASFTVTTADANMGTATWSFQGAQGDVYAGEEITLTATPKSGYMFSGWSDGTSIISNSQTCTVAVEEGKTYTANFALAGADYIVKSSTGTYTDMKSSRATAWTYTTTQTNPVKLQLTATNGSTPIRAIHSSNYLYNSGYDVNSTQSYTPITFTLSVPEGQKITRYEITYTISGAVTISNGQTTTNEAQTLIWTATEDVQSTSFTLSGTSGGYIKISNFTVSVLSTGGGPVTPPATPQYTATVSTNGTGGTATVNGQQSVTVDSGTEVTFVAIPANGYRFTGWSSGTNSVSDQATYTVNISADMNLMANFEAAPATQYTVTVSTNGTGGTATVNGGQTATVDAGSTVTIVATPVQGYVFDYWTVNGEQNDLLKAEENPTVNSDLTLVAYFREEQGGGEVEVPEYCIPSGTKGNDNYLTTVTTSGAKENISYSASSHPGSTYKLVDGVIKVNPGTSFTLNLVANSLGEGSSYTVREDIRYCHASLFTDFDINGDFGNAVQTWGNKPPTHNVYGNYDQCMNIAATINVPSNAAIGKSHIRVIYTNAWKDYPTACTTVLDKGIAYDFVIEVIKTYTVTVSTNGTGGTATVNGGQTATVASGTEVTFTASANTGYDFLGWFNGETKVNDNPEFTQSVTSNLSLTAKFAKQTFTVSATPNGTNGTVTVSPNTSPVEYGTEVTFTATAKPGYRFESWSNGETTNPYTVAVTENISLTANFEEIPTHSVNVSVNGNGSVEKSAESVLEGSTVTLTATPAEGYKFTGWSDGSTDNPYTVTVTENISLIANFAEEGKLLLTFACLSDLHAQESLISGDVNSVKLRESVTKTLTQIKEQENVDLIVLGGDYTSNNTILKESWEKTRELLVNETRGAFNGDKTPVIYVNGNHEYEVANYDALPKNYNAGEYYGTPMKTDIGALAAEDCFYETASNGTGTSVELLAAYHYVVNGFDFVVLNTGKNFFTSASDYSYSIESVNWCATKLAEIYASDPNKTVFFLVHIPFSDSKGISNVNKGMNKGNDAEFVTKLKSTLAKYPNLVMLYGHDHGTDSAYIREKTEERVTVYATDGSKYSEGAAQENATYYIQNFNTSKYLGFNSYNLATTDSPTETTITLVDNTTDKFYINLSNTTTTDADGYPINYLYCGTEGRFSGNNSPTPQGVETGTNIMLFEVSNPASTTITATQVTSITAGKTYMLVGLKNGNYYALSDEMYKFQESKSQRMVGAAVTIENGTITYTPGTASVLWTINKKGSASEKSFFSSFMGSMRYYGNTIDSDQLSERKIVQALMVYVYSDRVELKMKNYAQSGTINGITVNQNLKPYVSYRTVTHSAEAVTATPTITPQQGGVVNPNTEVTVTVDAPEWHNLYYTINGETPTEEVEDGQITFTAVKGEYVIKVAAQEGIRQMSPVASVTYTVIDTHGITVSSTEGGTAQFSIDGENVTLTATEPAEGYYFVGWSVGESAEIVSEDLTYTTAIVEDAAYKANYAKLTYTVNVSATNGGTVKLLIAGEETQIPATVEYGTEVTFSAEANQGYQFVNWSDNSTDNPYSITVTSNIELTANFDEVTPEEIYAEMCKPTFTGAGNNTYVKAAQVYGKSIEIPSELLNNVQRGYVPTPIEVVAGEEFVLDLTFAQNWNDIRIYQIENEDTANPAFTYGPYEGSYNDYGPHPDPFEAMATSGITVNGSTASFPITFSEDLAVGELAVIRVAVGNVNTPCAAVSGEGAYIDFLFVMVAPATSRTISVEANPAEGGTVTGATTAEGPITLTATANEGYEFVNWTVGEEVVGTLPTITDNSSENITYIANFNKLKEKAPQLTVVTATTSFTKYSTFDIANIKDNNYSTKFWSYNSQNIDSYIQVDLGSLYNVEDIVLCFPNNADYAYGAVLEVSQTATTDSWEEVASFTYEDLKSEVINEITLNTYTCDTDPTLARYVRMRITTAHNNAIQLAEFEVYGTTLPRTVTVTSSDIVKGSVFITSPKQEGTGTGGTGTGGTGTGGQSPSVTTNEDVTVLATANSGYRFVNWTIGGNQVGEVGVTTYTYTDDESAIITANFEKIPEIYTVSVSSNNRAMGSATMSATTPTVEEGTPVTFTATAYEGYEFVGWSVGESEDIVSTDNPYTTTINANTALTANFQESTSLGGRWYRIKEVNSGMYLNAANYQPHTSGSTGGVNAVAKNNSNDQIFKFVASGTNYTLKTRSGYNIVCQQWNVDALTSAGTVLRITETTYNSQKAIKINIASPTSNQRDGAFKIQNVEGTYYPFCDANNSDIATWVLEPVKISEVSVEKTSDNATIKVTTDQAATIKVGGNGFGSTTADNLTATLTLGATAGNVGDDIKIESINGYITSIECVENIELTNVPVTVTEIALRNTKEEEIVVDAPALSKITVVSDAENNVAKVSTDSDLSQGVQVVVEKEIKVPHVNVTDPTYFNFLSMPFALNTANIEYLNGTGSWTKAVLEQDIRVLLYKSDVRANGKYGDTWEKLTADREIPANQGFVIVGNSERGDTNLKMKLRFTSATEAYDGSVDKVIANSYRKGSGTTADADKDWNFNGVPYLTNGVMNGYTLYFHNGYGYEAVATDYALESEKVISAYQSVMYQANIESGSREIYITPSSVSRITKAADDVFARAYIAVDDAAPAKIILSDESSENFVVNEDAWYLAPTANAEPAAYFNIGGSDAAVTVQPEATELPMTVYTGAGTQHRIALSATDGEYEVYLKDAVTDEIVCLNDEDYNFTAAAKTTIANRFTVSMVEPTGIIEQAKAEGVIKAVVAGDVIKLYGTEEGDEVTLYTTGGMVITNAIAEDGVTTIETSTTGVLIIKVADQTIKVVK